MYVPRHNEEKRVPVLHDLMRREPFATLVTVGASGLFATHLPVVLEQEVSEFGVLRAHVSRANMQWRDYSPEVDALAIFAGHHHYISASWYPAAQETGAEVPTWNYVVVHAYGPLRVIDPGASAANQAWMRAHLEGLTGRHEAASARPWKMSDAPEDFLASEIRGIVGLELAIRRIEGKWKVSQNRNERDRAAVVEGLASLGTAESAAMRDLVLEAARGNHKRAIRGPD